MSVYGGDSWAPDAYRRKRRIDDLISDHLDKSHSRKIPNGKYVCLVCSNRPVLDTVSMLTVTLVMKVNERKFKELLQEGATVRLKREISFGYITEEDVDPPRTFDQVLSRTYEMMRDCRGPIVNTIPIAVMPPSMIIVYNTGPQGWATVVSRAAVLD